MDCYICSKEIEQPDESPFCGDCQENHIDELDEYIYQEFYYTEDDIPF